MNVLSFTCQLTNLYDTVKGLRCGNYDPLNWTRSDII